MRYMLVNVGPGGLQIDLHSPNPSYNRSNLHRPGAVVALSIPRGESVDILPHFDGSVEKAHASVKFSRDALRLLKPNLLHTYVCDDDGKPIDMEKLSDKEQVVEVETEGEASSTTGLLTDEGEETSVDLPADDPPADDPPADDPPADDPPADDPPADDPPADDPPADDPPAVDPPADDPPAVDPPADDLTKLKGIGEATAQKMIEAGITSFVAVAEADTSVLEGIFGSKKGIFGGSKVEDIKKQAKKLMK